MTIHAIMVTFLANNITQRGLKWAKQSSLMAALCDITSIDPLLSSHEVGYAGYNALLLKQPLAHNAAAWI